MYGECSMCLLLFYVRLLPILGCSFQKAYVLLFVGPDKQPNDIFIWKY